MKTITINWKLCWDATLSIDHKINDSCGCYLCWNNSAIFYPPGPRGAETIGDYSGIGILWAGTVLAGGWSSPWGLLSMTFRLLLRRCSGKINVGILGVLKTPDRRPPIMNGIYGRINSNQSIFLLSLKRGRLVFTTFFTNDQMVEMVSWWNVRKNQKPCFKSLEWFKIKELIIIP